MKSPARRVKGDAEGDSQAPAQYADSSGGATVGTTVESPKAA
jgi:hypothetical protein